jgi:hypothetical protein
MFLERGVLRGIGKAPNMKEREKIGNIAMKTLQSQVGKSNDSPREGRLGLALTFSQSRAI